MRPNRDNALAVALAVLSLAACGSRDDRSTTTGAPALATNRAPAAATPLLAGLTVPEPGEAHVRDPDGEDDGGPIPAGPRLTALATAPRAVFRRVAPPAGGHPLICDLTPLGEALYVTSAVSPINLDGARIHRYRPAPPEGDRWSLALDWDRGGEARVTHEVGGQGITRARVIDGRLWATDADAPLYGGFGLSTAPFEDYVFTSDTSGVFAPLDEAMRPPAGTRVLPLAFHVFDVIRYRGAVVATGGTVARSRAANRRGTRYPGGVFAGRTDDPLLPPRFTLGEGAPVGVVRGTYMHRFRGRLYIGLQNNERRVRWDLAVLTGDPLDPATPPPLLARVTDDGGWLTRRFASASGHLYWIASGYRGDGRGAAVFTSSDGLTFTRVRLPDKAGAPQDLVEIAGARYLLTRRGLYRAASDRPDAAFVLLAAAPPGDPFAATDAFCSAPLVAFADALWAGSTRGGAIYEISAAP